MFPISKIRKVEGGIVIGATVFYVVRRLFEYARDFDWHVNLAKWEGVGIRTIWLDLATYDHFRNTIFPTVTAGVFFLIAWYIFHYHVYPAIRLKKYDQRSLFFFFMVLLSIGISIFMYDLHKFYWRFRHDNHGIIIGLKVYSLLRKLYLVTDFVALIIIFASYEAIMQSYYYLIEKIREEGRVYYFLGYILTAILIFPVLFFITMGHLPVNFWNGKYVDFLYLPLIVLTIGFAQQIYFKKVLPLMGQRPANELFLPVFTALSIALVGSNLFEVVQYTTWVARGYHEFRFGWRNIQDIIIQFLTFSAISILAALLRRIFTRERISLTTAVSNKSAELSSLRAQINPHFLFNTLNTLYAVSLKESAEKTADGIQKLGDMMRFMLNENHQDRIPLGKEIEYLENYIAIQRMRTDESHEVEIKVNIQHPDNAFMIAPMLLNPFIENAFKHGISFRNPSWIYITLTHDDKRLYFKVHNSLHHRSGGETFSKEENNGVGLVNVRKRLELIYPDRYTLDIQESDQDYFVSLSLLLS